MTLITLADDMIRTSLDLRETGLAGAAAHADELAGAAAIVQQWAQQIREDAENTKA